VSISLVRHSNSNSSNARQLSKHVPPSRAKHHLASSLLSDDGIDSPTYDGDIESSTTAGPEPHFSSKLSPSTLSHHSITISSSSTSAATEVLIPLTPAIRSANHPVFISQAVPHRTVENHASALVTANAKKAAPNPAEFTPEDISTFVRRAIEGETWRKYKINPPPRNRPVRIYADGQSPPTCRHIGYLSPL
jgi:choline-phosphate cytidylyltransferase